MTFSRAFMRYWQDGFTHAKEGLPLKYYAKPRGLDNAMFQARITVYRVSSAFVDKEGKLFLKFGSEYESVDSIIKEYGKK